jgi:hypothetical protein
MSAAAKAIYRPKRSPREYQIKMLARTVLESHDALMILGINAENYNISTYQTKDALLLLADGAAPEQNMVWPYAVIEGLLEKWDENYYFSYGKV